MVPGRQSGVPDRGLALAAGQLEMLVIARFKRPPGRVVSCFGIKCLRRVVELSVRSKRVWAS